MSRADKFSALVLGGTAFLLLSSLAAAALRGSVAPAHYIVPLFGLGLLRLTRKLSSDSRVNVAVIAVALGGAAYLAEVGLFVTERGHYRRHFDYEVERMRGARDQGLPYDRRSQVDVVNDLNEQGVPAEARLLPEHWIATDGLGAESKRLFPLSGISRSLAVTCNETGTWVMVETDEHGFRNPLGLYGPGVADIAVIGDSFAFGACVADGEETSALLRRSGRRVLNLGSEGNGPLIELGTLKEYAEPFTPRTVLWFYFEGNDLRDLEREKRTASLMAYMDPEHSQGLLARPAELDALRREYHDDALERARVDRLRSNGRRRRCVALLCGLRRLVASRPPPIPPAGDSSVVLLEAIVEEAKNRVTAWGGEFLVVYLPSWRRYGPPGLSEAARRREEILGLLDAAGIDVLDFSAVVGTHPDPRSLFPFRAFGHYTPEGYRLLAAEIEARLAEGSTRR